MILTIKDIQKDIADFNNRISETREKFEALPIGRLPFKQHKKREKQRRDLRADIEHVLTLIRYANEGIQSLEQEAI